MSSPEGIAVGPGPRIYVADTGNDRVQVFRGDGTLERTIGSSGVGAGQLYAPRAIALSGDELIVAEAGNSRVQAFSLDGRSKRSAPLADPRGMDDVPGLGVAIASPMMGLFSFGEASLRSADIASALPEEAALSRPIDLASGEGLVAIADAGERRLVVLDDGLRLRRVLPVSGAAPVAVLPSSRREVESIFVADGTAVREIRMPVPSPLPVVQALRARLLASDIPGALALIHPLQRGLFEEIYHDIEADLPVDAAAMGALRVDLVRGDRAIVEMDTVLTVSGVDEATSAAVHLIRAEDGTWLILDY